jgi:hypothetical protein
VWRCLSYSLSLWLTNGLRFAWDLLGIIRRFGVPDLRRPGVNQRRFPVVSVFVNRPGDRMSVRV